MIELCNGILNIKYKFLLLELKDFIKKFKTTQYNRIIIQFNLSMIKINSIKNFAT